MATSLPTSVTSEPLGPLRARLDAVDAELHRLVRERMDIVERIAAAKGPQASVIRPAREAAVLENRLAVHSGSMPAEMLVHLWRVLMGAACEVQRPFTVHVARALDAARFLYGPLRARLWSTAEQAIEALAEAPGDVAVLAEDAGEAWWRSLGPAHVIGRYALSDGGRAVALGGEGVAGGTGPLALVLRDGDEHPSEVSIVAVGADDTVLGRYHPFPIAIPVAS